MSSSINRLYLFLLTLCCFSCGPSLKKQFQTSKTFEQGLTGIAIYDLEENKLIYEYNSDKYFTPASNTKLLTLYAGLKYLGDSIPAFSYKTTADSLYFSATGDPSFLNDKFEKNRSLDFLKNTNKQLIYIQSNWDDDPLGSGWAWDDYNYAFSAERSAFPIFGNTINTNYLKDSGALEVQPEYFSDSVLMKKSGTSTYRNFDSNQFHIGKPEADYSRSIPFRTSEKTSINILRDILNKTITYNNDADRISELDKTLYSVASDSLYKVMLHDSDNLIAEQILLMTSLKISDTLNTEKSISELLKQDFADSTDEIFWVDGSGLSRYNLITPRSMIEILRKIDKITGTERLMVLLPEAGKEGTLKNFLTDEAPFVYAKSGSLRNNYSLSGIMISNKGKILLFSFMNSNYTVPSKDLKVEMEKILISIREKY